VTSTFWSPEQEAVRDSARTFAEKEILPYLSTWEDAGEVPREVQRRVAQAGLLAVGYPEEVGGEGGNLLDAIAVQEGLFEGGMSSGAAAAIFTHGIALPHIIASGNPELIDRFVRPVLRGGAIGSLAITEPGGGSDVARIRTTARPEGDHYLVNGAKTFITSAVRADFVTTAVRTADEGAHGISLLVIEKGTPGFAVAKNLRKMGWQCSDTAEISFTDVRVPVTNLVGEENGGFAAIARAFVTERLSLAVHGYGIADRALRLAADYARIRETFGKPLVANQVVRHKLVKMHRAVDVARSYTRDVVRRHVAGENVLVEALHAKAVAVEASRFVTDEAVQLFGGLGFMRESEVERHYRDQRVLAIGGGATEVLDDLTARLLGYGR
jgi:acyl-CoA dehydrogenase